MEKGRYAFNLYIRDANGRYEAMLKDNEILDNEMVEFHDCVAKQNASFSKAHEPMFIEECVGSAFVIPIPNKDQRAQNEYLAACDNVNKHLAKVYERVSGKSGVLVEHYTMNFHNKY